MRGHFQRTTNIEKHTLYTTAILKNKPPGNSTLKLIFLTLLGRGGGLKVPNLVTFPNLLRTFRKAKKKISQCFGVIQKVWADSAPPPALKQHPGAPPY